MPADETTTRAYTLKLVGGEGQRWRELLWRTHMAVNRGAQVWGDWLLTLRGGLPPALADDRPERRVILALSWLSVESPGSLVPAKFRVASAADPERAAKVIARFEEILRRLRVPHPEEWVADCEPALTARIRDDAVWVDRSAAFAELANSYPGLSTTWATETLFDLMGGEDDYFSMPETDSPAPAKSRDFVQKAGGWLSRNWGSGAKSDADAIAEALTRLATIPPSTVVGLSGVEALGELIRRLGGEPDSADPESRFKQLKQQIGWKGRASKGAIALEQIRDASQVDADVWSLVKQKLSEEATAQATKGARSSERPAWMTDLRRELESRLRMPYRTEKDLIWEHGVTLDHALRRVSVAHSWMKRAEVSRRQFQEDARRIFAVDARAREWLDQYREERSQLSAANEEYLIRKSAIDGWDKVVQAWAELGPNATRRQRVNAAREVQANLDADEKFGDIQLFAGFGDDDEDAPHPSLADDDAVSVWCDPSGKPDAGILKAYVAATVAEHNQRRFKVPAFRHPDPLRHPVYVDFGNSRWTIAYSALRAAHDRRKLLEKLERENNETRRKRLQQQLDEVPELREVTLSVWTGEDVERLPLRWQSKRLWKDLGLSNFGSIATGKPVPRADRLGRAAGGITESLAAVTEVFHQKDWNGRLQVSRAELDQLAELIYGRNAEPDYAKLDAFRPHKLSDSDRAFRQWQRLKWFLSFSAKLQPIGPWLDYVSAGLPEGIAYRKGRNGWYLNYAANLNRASRARLQLSRLPGLRVLSLDLGHRYAAACAVWETISRQQLEIACRASGQPLPDAERLFIHLREKTAKQQESGKRKGQPVVRTTIYRRIGPDVLPDGSPHAAPWARLDRQFLIKLQGEQQPARFATEEEWQGLVRFREFLGLKSPANNSPKSTSGHPTVRVDELQKDAVRIARLGLRRLADCARVAYILTAKEKPAAGGRTILLENDEQRIEYRLDALLLWQGLAQSSHYRDPWAISLWEEWVVGKLGGPAPVELPDEISRSERKQRINSSRAQLRRVAEQLKDADSPLNAELNRLWTAEWERRNNAWRQQLRWLRRFILPRPGKRPNGNDPAALQDWKVKARQLRHVGGLSLKRLKTIRDLYLVLKAYRMRPQPEDLRANVLTLGDRTLSKFGRRILDQLERLREQRIKQLASRIIEAALGVGSEDRRHFDGRRRPGRLIDDPRFAPCHAVVIENLEHYRPEESRLRRENAQLMTWAARNVRKYIVEGSQLHGLYFTEISPAWTSRQDSRTGAPGIRCEEVLTSRLMGALRSDSAGTDDGSLVDLQIRWIQRDLNRARKKVAAGTATPREQFLAGLCDRLVQLDAAHAIASLPPTVLLPRNGGELFVPSLVEADDNGRGALQADLNAAANIGLRALTDPDWYGAWWYLLVETESGQPVVDKLKGCPVWENCRPLLAAATSEPNSGREPQSRGNRNQKGTRAGKSGKRTTYAWNVRYGRYSPAEGTAPQWQRTQEYWRQVEESVTRNLMERLFQERFPW